MIDGSQPGRAGNCRYFSRRIKDNDAVPLALDAA